MINIHVLTLTKTSGLEVNLTNKYLNKYLKLTFNNCVKPDAE